MGVINVLDKHVAELIAAGEVVERPASAIKELVENAIDAGAKNITVEIKNGGTTFIRVTDDGCGIMKDDIKKAFMRHATSKVKIEDDLNSIHTLGFRGEALASISAVSKLELITRYIKEDMGTCYKMNGGQEVDFSDAGCPIGTTFIVRDLFYNVPARMKFLKKDVSEGNAVSAVMDKTALSHPEISFMFIKDGKTALKTSGDGKLKTDIYSVLGRDFATSIVPVNYELNGVKVQGYISKPSFSRPNRNLQNFFINGRYVKTKTASVALEEAFKGSIMIGKFPSCVLQLIVPFEAIDVNVHPSKTEVRFINERPVFDAVYHGVKSALLLCEKKDVVLKNNNSAFNDIKQPSPFHMAKSILRKDSLSDSKKQSKNNNENAKINPFDELDLPIKNTVNNTAKENAISFAEQPIDIYSKVNTSSKSKQQIVSKFDNNTKTSQCCDKVNLDNHFKPIDIVKEKNISEASKQANSNIENEQLSIADDKKVGSNENMPNIRFIGEIFSTYIVLEENEKELVLVDKHAAHERIIYEKLKKEKAHGFSQLLLEPITVTLSGNEYNAAINNINLFHDYCFDIEDFGNGVIIVRSAPQYLDSKDICDSVTEMADYISQNKQFIASEKMDWVYHNIACRAAIKGGNKNSNEELMEIVDTLKNDPTLRHCPHGRPICIVLSKYEIEKQFGRV